MSDSSTYEDALKNAKVVVDKWIETATSIVRSIQEPKGRLYLNKIVFFAK